MLKTIVMPVAAAVLSCSIAGWAGSAVDGVWKTEGYGYLFDIRGDEVAIYEQTSISCLKSALAAGRFKEGQRSTVLGQFPVSIPGFIDAQMEVYAGEEGAILFHRTDTNTFMTAQRQSQLPEECLSAPAGGVNAVASVFVQTFKENYPFAAIDWPGAIAPDTSEAGLFEALTGRLGPLQDSHVALVAPSLDAMYFGAEGATASVPEENRQKGFSIVESSYLQNQLVTYAKGMLAYAYLKPGVGYLRIGGFTDYSAENSPEANLTALEDALDDIFAPEHGLAALVLDIRDNFGGSDKLALALAARMSDVDYTAYAKQAVAETRDGQIVWIEPRDTVVEASSVQEKFLGELVLLTGPDTISAGETFTMALMGRTPEVTRVGENTRGAFADMLPRILPNGWLFALPNEQYLDSTGQSYGRTGIPPHLVVESFGAEALEAGRDPALEVALQILDDIM
ncbi:MAG: S41 family peptidase [Alphaproteobacteria bacterium]|nr:S41 family peptidase [Alphaproteobacteria bacterium]